MQLVAPFSLAAHCGGADSGDPEYSSRFQLNDVGQKAKQDKDNQKSDFFYSSLNSIPARNSRSIRVEGRNGITTSIQRAGEEMPPLSCHFIERL